MDLCARTRMYAKKHSKKSSQKGNLSVKSEYSYAHKQRSIKTKKIKGLIFITATINFLC